MTAVRRTSIRVFMRTLLREDPARRLFKGDAYLAPQQGYPVELHFYEHGPGRWIFPRVVDFSEKYWRATEVAGVSTHALAGKGLVLYLMSHGSRSGWPRLKWLLDLRRLTRDYGDGDWKRLEALAGDDRLSLCFRLSAAMLMSCFGAGSVPVSLHGSLDGFRSRCLLRQSIRWLSQDRLEGAQPPLERARFELFLAVLAERHLQRFWQVAPFAVRPMDYERFRLPSLVIWLVWPIVRPMSFVARMVKRFFR